MNRIVFISRAAIVSAVGAIALFGAADALGGSFLKTVKLDQGAATSIVRLPAASGMTFYTVSVTGPTKANVTVDLRGSSGSIKYPGIFSTTIPGQKRLKVYTFRPLESGDYRVAVTKKNGPAINVSLKVISKPAEAPKAPTKKN